MTGTITATEKGNADHVLTWSAHNTYGRGCDAAPRTHDPNTGEIL